MTKTLAILALVSLLAGCQTHTSAGPCIGAFDDKNPALTYKVSSLNVVLGIVFFELIAPPVFVLADETLCPVSK
jgi:hypothetical protein